MEELVKKAKREYSREQYHKNPEKQKGANYRYWKNKAIEYFGTEHITEGDIAHVRNEYYKKYRNANKDKVNKATNDFWKRKVEGE